MITKHEVVTVDHALARKFLAINTQNFRNLNHAYARLLARDMSNNNWHENGESIKISADEKTLIDGQNRCQGLLYSTADFFRTLVIYTTDSLGIDKGKSRTLANYLSNLGVSNSPTVSAIIKLCMAYNEKQTFPSGGFKVTDDAGLEFWGSRNTEAFDFASYIANKLSNQNLGSRNVWGAVAYEVGKNPDNHQKFDTYVDLVIGRGGRRAGDSADNVRRVVDELVFGAAQSRGVISFNVLGGAIVKGWNSLLRDKSLPMTKARQSVSDTFPLILTDI